MSCESEEFQIFRLSFGEIVTQKSQLLIVKCRNVDSIWDEGCTILCTLGNLSIDLRALIPLTNLLRTQ
jgi:hypothetical protein